jgi:FixJ family two-component response regulator
MKGKKLRVMVVDDSPTVLSHLRFALERAGHSVTTRDSALGTMSELMRIKPEALILDVSMPALAGDRLAALASDLRKDVVIILHSSLSPSELAELARKSGASGFISKTADTMRFLSEFHRIMFGEVVAFPALR